MTNKEFELRRKFVQVARAYVGAKGGDSRHKDIVDTYNTLSPLPRGHKLTYTDDWCAAFVSVIAIKSKIEHYFPYECSCNNIISSLISADQWIEDDSYKPYAGDLIFYDWNDTTGSNSDNKGRADHVGIVSQILDFDRFYVIEGNSGNSVKEIIRNVNQKNIRGFGVLRWDLIANKNLDKELLWTIENKIFKGDEKGDLKWDEPIKRKDVARVLYRLYNLINK